uniref:Major facilitator superfamily (MFS) profile domain-containing protein n=1 Tax=Globisporangium ultimum (strain ATCC 200006 / CBS 805.95 / DAOM BR144) TaxID=431595 RepID=K3WAP5_GLOUD
MTTDIEVGQKNYSAFASPKFDGIQDGETQPKESASVVRLMLIAMPRLAMQMTWAAQWAALGPYLGTMLPNYAVQLTQFIGPIVGITVAPIVGVLSDRSTSKWGRRRPILLVAAVLSVICWMLMGYTRQIGEALGDYGTGQPNEETHRPWTTFLTVILYAWMDITVNIAQAPAFLMIADFSGDRQTLGSAIGQGWSLIGSLLVACYISAFGPAHKSLRWFLGMLSVVMLVTVGIACVAAKETPLKKDENDKTTTWQQVKAVFVNIYRAVITLPASLAVYSIIFFFIGYGYTAYNGNKGQFFGLVVYDGESSGADSCGSTCTEAQNDYNDGVSLAGGNTDIVYNIVGYLYSWALPFMVRKFGAKSVLAVSLVPQCLLLVMAFTKVVAVDVIIVVITSVSQTVMFALMVPVIIHVMGPDIDIGAYFGVLNSAQCFGQLLNFAIGSALVETSMGYKLPVLLGGIMTVIGVLITVVFLKLKMNAM